MNNPIRDYQGNKRFQPQGLPVPEPHNDISLTVVQFEATGEPERARWPMLVIILALMGNLAWVGLLGWLVFKLVMWLAG